MPEDSILEETLTLSPNKQYRGIFCPTTPAHTDPECIPILILS